ncbi:MAG: hypothetical protein ACRCT8_02340 [Lacipirellulaceae bacterium]
MRRHSLVLLSVATLLAVASPAAQAHERHDHDQAEEAAEPATASPAADATTGAGELKFRYREDLSELPEGVAKGIVRAHGGFAKVPTGDVYFGLEGTGVVRVSADLTTKTLLKPNPATTDGGLHNTTYVERNGGMLVVPDNNRGFVLLLSMDGDVVASLGRPGGDIDKHYEDAANPYAPTDTEVAPDGVLYICDGYGSGKFVLTADIEKMVYTPKHFGGPVPGEGRTEGKFSTNHGVTYDPTDNTLAVADRERQWVQKLNFDGEFVSGIDLEGANPCDVDHVDWQGSPLTVVGCLVGPNGDPGVVQLVRGDKVVSTIRPKLDLGLSQFQHVHNAAGIVVEGKLFLLVYGWNPGCYAVLEQTP